MEPVLVSVEVAAKALGIGRSKAWELVTAGELRTIRIGRLVKVPVAAIHEFVAARVEAADEERREKGQAPRLAALPD